jgi:hypothetical protein
LIQFFILRILWECWPGRKGTNDEKHFKRLRSSSTSITEEENDEPRQRRNSTTLVFPPPRHLFYGSKVLAVKNSKSIETGKFLPKTDQAIPKKGQRAPRLVHAIVVVRRTLITKTKRRPLTFDDDGEHEICMQTDKLVESYFGQARELHLYGTTREEGNKQ